MTTIKVIRKFRGNQPRFIKQNKRSKGYIETYQKSLGKFSEIKRRKDLTARQHNILGFLSTILRLKVPPADGHINTKENSITKTFNQVKNNPDTASQHEFFVGGVRSNGFGRKDPLFHPGIRQNSFGWTQKQTISAFNPIQKGSKNINQNSIQTQKGSRRRARRSWTW